MKYELEKWIWTESDFEKMGWHDAPIWGLRLNVNLEFDIDYILKWNDPDIEGMPFTFWIAPSTLVFETPTQLSFELLSTFEETWLEIEDIEQTREGEKKRWTIATGQGDISFIASSFKQIIRQAPSLRFSQSVPYDERGGVSFEMTPGEKAKIEPKPEIVQRRIRELELYEIAKKRAAIKKELKLLQETNEQQIPSKEFLKSKNDLKLRINSYNKELFGSQFEGW
jgi:hypothetical protein